MVTFGLEREFFCVQDEEPTVVPVGIPADSCGWLVEARGKAFRQPREAVYSLMAEQDRIAQLCEEYGVGMWQEPVMKVSRAVRHTAARKTAKGLVEYQNIYGYERHRERLIEGIASTQVTMRKTQTFWANKEKVKVGVPFDFPRIIQHLDEVFADEIKDAKRNPGFYEMKPDGMVEYRSLPNKLDDQKLIEALEEVVQYF